VVCVSESTARAVRDELFRGKLLDTRVVFNGIDCSTYCTDLCEKFEKPTVLYLGRLKPYKQLPRLIRMMPVVRERVPEVELLIAGAGEAILEAEAEVKEIGAEEYVRFLWEVSEQEKVDLYRRAWVTATASMIEGWGLTVIEANACGTPAVAFDVPGLNESIVAGRTGMLASDDLEFAGCLAEILTDEELRARLAAGAVEWSNSFDWDATAGRTLEILEEAVGKDEERETT
jgi:glycosyltransferase involved in cell wall biosynthesis